MPTEHLLVTGADPIDLIKKLDNLAESGWRAVGHAAVARAHRDAVSGDRVEYSALLVREWDALDTPETTTS
jgi:hypothetical protein